MTTSITNKFLYYILHRTVVGYVEIREKVMTKKNRKTGEDIMILRFIVSNNDQCRIQCVIWNEDIEKFGSLFELHDVSMLLEYTRGLTSSYRQIVISV